MVQGKGLLMVAAMIDDSTLLEQPLLIAIFHSRTTGRPRWFYWQAALHRFELFLCPTECQGPTISIKRARPAPANPGRLGTRRCATPGGVQVQRLRMRGERFATL
jgi:hypothetical protein